MTVISVHGWIEGAEEAGELSRVVRDAPAGVVLDLRELQNADDSGLDVLNLLAEEGVTLSGASDFIKLMLETNGHRSPTFADEKNGGDP